MNLTQFANVSGLLLGVLPSIFFICAFVLLWARTQSRHVLLYRLWRLLHGSQPIHDPEVSAFIEEQTSLMSFRFLTGVQAKTLESARQLIQWAKFHDVEVQDIARCGNYFDPDLRRVRANMLPSALQWKLTVGLTILVCLVAVGMLASIGVSDAILKFKTTDHWFFLNTEKASVIWPLQVESLKKSDCVAKSDDIAQRTFFSESEISVLCPLLTSPEIPDYIGKTVLTQRLSFAFGFLVFALLSWNLFLQSMKYVNVKRLQERNLSPDITGEQIYLQFDEN